MIRIPGNRHDGIGSQKTEIWRIVTLLHAIGDNLTTYPEVWEHDADHTRDPGVSWAFVIQPCLNKILL